MRMVKACDASAAAKELVETLKTCTEPDWVSMPWRELSGHHKTMVMCEPMDKRET
jgi:hypothetical protein